MSIIGTSTVAHTRRRVVSVLASFALAATFARFGLARKQQRYEQRHDAEVSQPAGSAPQE